MGFEIKGDQKSILGSVMITEVKINGFAYHHFSTFPF